MDFFNLFYWPVLGTNCDSIKDSSPTSQSVNNEMEPSVMGIRAQRRPKKKGQTNWPVRFHMLLIYPLDSPTTDDNIVDIADSIGSLSLSVLVPPINHSSGSVGADSCPADVDVQRRLGFITSDSGPPPYWTLT